jgi:hypothetical protein
MTHYSLSVQSVVGEIREPMTDDQMKESFNQIGILEAETKPSERDFFKLGGRASH